MDFEKKSKLKGIEKRTSAKGKDYSIIIVEDEKTGRTLDFYHDGVITLENEKFYNFLYDYSFSYGKGQMKILGIK